MTAVKIPFEDARYQYVEEEGSDGFAGFGFRDGSDVKIPYRGILPEKLPAEFSILMSVRPLSTRPGYLFAVVNSHENMVQLGVKLATHRSHSTKTIISLIYTDPSQLNSDTIAYFTVDRFVNVWTKFAFKVTTDNVTLFFNCEEFDTMDVKRNPLELTFESASTLYIAKAGSKIDENYEVSEIIFLNFYENGSLCDCC